MAPPQAGAAILPWLAIWSWLRKARDLRACPGPEHGQLGMASRSDPLKDASLQDATPLAIDGATPDADAAQPW